MSSVCPFCRKHPSASKPLWPFCSERCKEGVLGKWAKEEYRISGPAIDEELLGELEPELDADDIPDWDPDE